LQRTETFGKTVLCLPKSLIVLFKMFVIQGDSFHLMPFLGTHYHDRNKYINYLTLQEFGCQPILEYSMGDDQKDSGRTLDLTLGFRFLLLEN